MRKQTLMFAIVAALATAACDQEPLNHDAEVQAQKQRLREYEQQIEIQEALETRLEIEEQQKIAEALRTQEDVYRESDNPG